MHSCKITQCHEYTICCSNALGLHKYLKMNFREEAPLVSFLSLKHSH